MSKIKTLPKIYLVVIIITVFLGVFNMGIAKAQSVEDNQGDVMGTSVEVTAPQLDIKRVEIEESYQNEDIQAELIVKSSGGSEKQLDKAVLIVKNLDGSIAVREETGVNKNLQAKKENKISLMFPSNLQVGKYVGVFELYSGDDFLGSSETILSIIPPTPEVLGASVVSYDNLLMLLTVALFIIIILLLLLFWRGKKILFKGGFLKVYDLAVVSMALSVFGFGICSGYLLCKIFYPNDSLDVKGRINIFVNGLPLINNSSDKNSGKLVKGGKDLILYVRPDEESEIKYELKDGEELEIIDEAAGWYRVLLENGSHGWVRIEELQN